MTLTEVLARMLRTKTNAVFAPPGASYEMAAALLATPEGRALAVLVEAAVRLRFQWTVQWPTARDDAEVVFAAAVDAYLALEGS